MVRVISSVFKKKNTFGDFSWMITQPQYNKTLFLYNDDIESRNRFNIGGGNAIIRPYNKYNPKIKVPRSAGIPTGSLKTGGFVKLDNVTKKYIDDSIENIQKIIKIYKYETIIYSAELSGLLGTGIFKVNTDVILYITEKIKNLDNGPKK